MPKRRTGYVRPLSKAKFEVVVTAKDPETGLPRKISRTVNGTSKDADRRLAKLITEVHEGEVAPRSTKAGTYSELIDAWLASRRGEVSPTTYDRDVHAVEPLRERFGSQRPEDVTTANLEALYASLRRKGLAGATVVKTHQAARNIGAMAQRHGIVRVNTAAEAKPPKIVKADTSAPTTDEVRRLIESARKTNPTMAAMLHVGATTGMRRGELAGLHVEDLDLDAATITVRRSVVLDGSAVVEKGTKTSGRRKVSIDEVTVGVLRSHLKLADKVLATLGAERIKGAYVFSPQPDGSRAFRPDTLTTFVARHGEKLAIKTNLYAMTRHYAATQLISNGVDPTTAAERLGHSPTVLLQRYSHVRPERDREAAGVAAL